MCTVCCSFQAFTSRSRSRSTLLVLSSHSWLSEMPAFSRSFMRRMHCSCALLNAASAASYPPASACATPVCRHQHGPEYSLGMAVYAVCRPINLMLEHCTAGSLIVCAIEASLQEHTLHALHWGSTKGGLCHITHFSPCAAPLALCTSCIYNCF